ncbi:MAG: glycoside hydrolase family 140 protein [Saprospiraceae bacterium]|nr:glycoside hydrolase family 140 protein [Lewinella sp.]
MRYLLFLLPLFIVSTSLAQHMPHGSLRVSDNSRFLVHADGTPFFWQGDTAWELFHRCSREEAEEYLQKRRSQGFNVIQAVALAEVDGLHTPNAYGERPLKDDDPTQPNPKYFEHVDYIVDRAAELGMYIALLPTWGDKLFTNRWGVGPEVFNPENARTYGKWIGTRYKDRENIIWVLGGDRNPRPETDDVTVWREMANGIAEGCGGQDKALMTLHPQPASPGGSSNWFHQDEWLDFNMHQTGHCANKPTYELIGHDYNLSPVKPVLDGEPLYEDHPNCFNAKELGYSVPEDIRRIMYWNVFAGAFGQTYGCHDIWQMYTNERQPINGPLRPWKKALDLPMAWQVRHLKHLMLSRPFLTRIPDQRMIVGDQPEGEDYVIATRDENGSYAMIYFPTGKAVTLDLSALSGKKIRAWWFDPRTGNAYTAGKKIRNNGRQLFPPPTSGRGNDWVLVLDDAKIEFPVPGQETRF